MAAGPNQINDIRKFEEIGTHPAANHDAISQALVFTENIGIERKSARLRYLEESLGAPVEENPKCKILHMRTRRSHAGLGFWRLMGRIRRRFTMRCGRSITF